MKREHHYNRLPFLRRSIFSRQSLDAAVDVFPKIPIELLTSSIMSRTKNAKKLILS
jgi:hypothetical protein